MASRGFVTPLFISTRPSPTKFARLQLHYQPGVCALRCEKPKAPHEIPSGMATKAKIPAAHFLRAGTLRSGCLRLSGSGRQSVASVACSFCAETG